MTGKFWRIFTAANEGIRWRTLRSIKGTVRRVSVKIYKTCKQFHKNNYSKGLHFKKISKSC
jgi:hypothetical protein